MATKEEARNLLPKVGDILMKPPTMSNKAACDTPQPQKCEVIGVNHAHLWYRVKFLKSGTIECYKVPEGTAEPRPEKPVKRKRGAYR